MTWLFRPTNLVLLAAALAVAAAALVLWPPAPDRSGPLPVPAGDQEIVWLNHATNVRDWERFATAVRRARLPGLDVEVDESRAFPRETTVVPEIRLGVRGKAGRLLIRWYKLTGDMKTSDWVRALRARRPAPLAIIGGGNSESALELARQLRQGGAGPGGPLFLITQATADNDPTTGLPLTDIYEGRTFRFCFTNKQMARAVTDFIWNRDHLLPAGDPLRRVMTFLWGQDGLPPADENLRPDADPAYLEIWDDDPYSRDLADSFMAALRLEALRATSQDWLWATGLAAGGGVPLDLVAVHRGHFYMSDDRYPLQWHIFHGIGGFNRANHAEEQRADELLAELARHPDQLRPLLVLPATSQPCRRFLRALRRNAPVAARQFVVVTGDSIDFNKVYRDRNLTWPIQDLPVRLVFFCHRDPVDRVAGFREQNPAGGYNPNRGSPTSGTEDLLLYVDVVQTVVRAAYAGPGLPGGADELAGNLRQIPWRGERMLFTARGNRHSGTGEHVVYLRPPPYKNGRVAPQAEIEVWARLHDDSPGPGQKSWVLRRFLTVLYDNSPGEGGG